MVRASAGDPDRRPVATLGIAALCAAVFAVELMMGLKRGAGLPLLGGGHPADMLRAGALVGSLEPALAEPFRLLSAVFVHFGLLHFGMNMWVFVSHGKIVERVLGSARLLTGFVLTGALSFVASVAWAEILGGRGALTAGASGAVLGTMGLLCGVMARRKDPVYKRLLGEILVYTLVFGFAVNASGSGVMINNAAHIGGLAAGFVLGLAWGRRDLPPEGTLAKGLAVACIVASLASLVLAQLSPLASLVER